jgi:uncharacterized damage-inducible protein DinB
MAEDNFTLTTFYTSWKEYQDPIKGAIAPLTAEQLELRAAPHLRSIGENALHIIGCRAFWFTNFLGEDGQEVDLSRAWVVWHVLEHDLHHGGELSLTLGMHRLPADFPG